MSAPQNLDPGRPIRRTPWPHAPTHHLSQSGTYFVTVGTYHKQHHFGGADRLCELHGSLLGVAAKFGWQLEAWAVFSNHYHIVAHSPATEAGAVSLSRMLGLLHEKTAKYEKSYLARLHYTHQNAVKHSVVKLANLYPWCSAAWFERTASPAQVRTIYSFNTDKLQVSDDYDVASEW